LYNFLYLIFMQLDNHTIHSDQVIIYFVVLMKKFIQHNSHDLYAIVQYGDQLILSLVSL